ncbi:hypothetical protein Dsin_016169 [Dipteronia sinensis]|uniref:TTF-type domain-containing protein n=1 Tax=Dipteronia sinensis TaxID=43782 RepID=A0AAE0E6P4_9ROSI|nr:hypothetical protein Dsin_016169 [Dipteronia sinensis]
MGPVRVTNLVYPVENNRSFNDKYYTRSLANGENYDRPWLVYSQLKNKVFCFCCVLFKNGLSSPLTNANQGYNDWGNISGRLVEHEKSSSHMLSMKAWKETELRLKKIVTIDVSHEKAINKEKEYWKDVL